jgi:hypothetical protein
MNSGGAAGRQARRAGERGFFGRGIPGRPVAAHLACAGSRDRGQPLATPGETRRGPVLVGTMADDEEYVQLTIPEAFVYRVPPRTSAQGYK